MAEKLEQKKQSIPLTADPASGQFIVADILPPRNRDIRFAASRTDSQKKQKLKKEVSVRSQPDIQKELGNEGALNKWFRKEQTVRTNRSDSPFRTQLASFSGKRKFIMLWIVFLLFLGAGAFGISYAMSRLEVVIKLKTVPHDFDQRIFIDVDPAHKSALAGERIELSDSGTQAFPASGTADVKAKAKGVISIYNAFNTSPQQLVANTRFEAPDGKIYRLRAAVIVPSAVLENGSLSPRSIDATVFADQPGPEYNRGLTDFTIPGFKNSPRYTGFYARSKTPLEGGHIGSATIVTKEDIDKAYEALESLVRSRLMESLKKSVPEGFVLLDDAIEITSDSREFSHEAEEVAKEFSASIALRARSLVFKRSALQELFAKEASLDSSLVSLDNPDEIRLTVNRRNMDNGTLFLQAKGIGVFVWNLDVGKLAVELAAAQNPGTFAAIFQQYPAIDNAEVRFVPSWIHIVPHNSARIQIVTDK